MQCRGDQLLYTSHLLTLWQQGCPQDIYQLIVELGPGPSAGAEPQQLGQCSLGYLRFALCRPALVTVLYHCFTHFVRNLRCIQL